MSMRFSNLFTGKRISTLFVVYKIIRTNTIEISEIEPAKRARNIQKLDKIIYNACTNCNHRLRNRIWLR